MVEESNLDERETFRLFSEEKDKAQQIVDSAKDSLGYKKYANKSHFYRCAVIRLIKEEL